MAGRGEPPTFSVIVAAYQAAATLREAVDSALTQTSPPLEVIVCDDGSTDATPEVIETYGDRIVALRRANGGEGAAKNDAAAVASGEYLAILDADDVYLPDRLRALGELAVERPDLDILTTDADLEVGGRFVRRCYTDEWQFPWIDQRAAILERNFVFGLAAVRRTAFAAAGGFSESIRYGADWDLWIRMILDGSAAGLVPAVLARYRIHAGSLSASRSALLAGRAEVLERAAADRRLSADERLAVFERASRNRAAALLGRSHEALERGAPEGRGLALSVARCGDYEPATRARFALAAAAPRTAGALIRRRARRHGRPGPAGLMLPG